VVVVVAVAAAAAAVATVVVAVVENWVFWFGTVITDLLSNL
jgi:hypothetical protein